MSNPLSHRLIMTISILLFYSCQKDAIPFEKETASNASYNLLTGSTDIKRLVEKSMSWYNANGHSIIHTNVKESKNIVGTPDWDRITSFVFIDSLRPFIRVPIMGYKVDCSYQPDMSRIGFRDMLFKENTDGVIQSYVIELHPNAEYLDKKKLESEIKEIHDETTLRNLMKNEDFTGYFLVYDMSNILYYGEKRVNGIPTSRLQFKNH